MKKSSEKSWGMVSSLQPHERALFHGKSCQSIGGLDGKN